MTYNHMSWSDFIKNFEVTRGIIEPREFNEELVKLGIVDSYAGLNLVYEKYDADNSREMSATEFYNAF